MHMASSGADPGDQSNQIIESVGSRVRFHAVLSMKILPRILWAGEIERISLFVGGLLPLDLPESPI